MRPPVLVVAFAAASMASCGPSPDSAGSEGDVAVVEYANHAPEATYVGRDVCGQCHADRHATYVQSEMGRSFKRATRTNSDADFDGPDPVYDPSEDLYYQPFHVGEDLFLREYRLTGGDTVYQRVEQIAYIVGSGQHTNSHIMDVNGFLYQMPLTWYTQDKRWDLPPLFEGNNARFDRPIPLQCMTCHNGMPTFVDGSENRFTHVPEGIGCERCHGPGSLHVEAIKAGRVVDTSTEIDPTIVNPAKLPIDRQLDICQSCHAQGVTVFEEGKTPMDFRPGQRLADVQKVYWPRFSDTATRFTMASHPDRLKMSECFRASHEPGGVEPLTCITCHNPHVSIETLGADHYNSTCQSCHDAVNALPGCTEAPEVRAEVGDNCVSCHMPRSGTEDIPHVRITDHFIRAVEQSGPAALAPEETNAVREFLGMASLINEVPGQKELADSYMMYFEQITNRPDFLDSASVHLRRARESGEETFRSDVQLRFLQKDYAAVASLAREVDPAETDAWTAYRIGESFLGLGRADESIRYLERAAQLAPEHLRFLNRLASAYQQDGQLDAAIATYDRVLSANPRFHASLNNRGFARAMSGDIEGAESDFQAALALEPDEEQTIANLASLYYNTGRPERARPYALRLVRMAPDNAQYRRLLDLVS